MSLLLLLDIDDGLRAPVATVLFVTCLGVFPVGDTAMQGVARLLIQWRNQPAMSVTRGQLFENWDNKKLVKGGIFTVRNLEHVR